MNPIHLSLHRWQTSWRQGIDLRARLMWLAVLPVLVFATTWGVYAVRQRFQELEMQEQQRAQLLARQLAVAAEYGVFSRNLANLNSLTQGVMRENAVTVAAVLEPGLQALAWQQAVGALPIQLRDQWLISNAPNQATSAALSVGSTQSSVLDGGFLQLEPIHARALELEDLPEVVGVPADNTLVGYALVEVSTRHIRTELWQYGFRVLAIFLVVAISAWFMARRFGLGLDRRIQTLAQAATDIGAGRSGVRLGHTQVPTFDRLSQDINRMAEQLEASRRDLEQRIGMATAALRAQRDAAQQASQSKTRFLAAASHDLRQPMHALSLLIEAIKQEPDPLGRTNLMGQLETTAQTMSSLLDALLDISRLDAGSVQQHKKNSELKPLFVRLNSTFQPLAEQKNIELHVRFTSAQIHTDPMLLERILGNLLSNAIRYTPSGGRVLLLARPRGGHWELQVRDSGPGIPPESQSIIFEEFVQLANSQRDRSQGLGLGLGIVQRLAHLLGHRVAVRSAPGQGATFSVQVPRATAGMPFEAPVVPSVQPDVRPLSLLGKRILLVEDDALVRASYRGLLQLWSCDLREYASAEDALASLRSRQWRPELIVSDQRLGGGYTGVQLIDQIRQEFSPGIPAVLITGDTEDAALRHVENVHTRVLFKPVKPMVLRQMLVQLLQSQTRQAPAIS